MSQFEIGPETSEFSWWGYPHPPSQDSPIDHVSRATYDDDMIPRTPTEAQSTHPADSPLGASDGIEPAAAFSVDRLVTDLFAPDTWKRAAFLGSRFPIGLAWFLILVIGLSVGLATAIIFIGLLLLAALVQLVREGARLERGLIAMAGGPTIQDPYRQTSGDSPRQRWMSRLTDPATYRDAIYLLLQFPLGLVSFVVLVVSLAMTVGAMAVPVLYNRFGDGHIRFFNDDNSALFVIDRLWKALLFAAIGLALVPLLPIIVRAMSAVHFAVATLLLGRTRREEVTEAVEQRDLGLSADMTERRRIERDLHDGAQQRLVAMTMELGRAKAKLDDDPNAARELLDSAHDHAKAAMQELRDLARGIAPPLLADRGLDAALSALAARSPIPVDLSVQVNRRVAESVESVAYFVIAEAITNVAKHSRATLITVRVMDHTTRLSVSVVDNGIGGVDPTGSGVAGLADRVRSVGGDFMARNGNDGGVEILAEIPCAS